MPVSVQVSRTPSRSSVMIRDGCLRRRSFATCCNFTALREKLVKIDAKVVSDGRHVTFLLAEVAVPRKLFQKILRLIDGCGQFLCRHDGGPIQVHPGRPTGQVSAARVEVRPHSAKWSGSRASHRQFSLINSGHSLS